MSRPALILSCLSFFILTSLVSTLPTPPSTGAGQLDVTSHNPLPTGDFVESDEDFEALIERLKKESEENLALNRANYVADDISAEEIMRLIDEAEISRENPAQNELTTTTGSTSIVTTEQSDAQETDCAICLSSMKGTRASVMDYCKHKFHQNCLTQWFRHSNVS